MRRMEPREPRSIAIAARLVAASVLALAVSVGCSDDATAPDDTRSSQTGPFIVSEPVAGSGAVAGLVDARSMSLSASAAAVYVSLPPGSVPGGTTAIVRTAATGASVEVPVADGGFDPVAIAASVGDKLVIDVRSPAGLLTSLSVTVPPRRPPRVVRVEPPKGKRDVPLNYRIAVVFSEPIDAATASATTVKLTSRGAPVAGVVQLDASGLVAEFIPQSLLAPNAEYELAVTTGVRDRGGEPLEDPLTSQFVTGTVVAGSIRVTTVTTGEDLDSDGYRVSLGGLPLQPMGVNATVIVEGRPQGEYGVWLLGAAENCSIAGSNPRSVTVTSGAETAVRFDVACDRSPITFATAGNMSMPRAGHTATLLRDGRVLIAGGGFTPGGPVASAELYDPATGTFKATGSMTTARMGHSATLLPDGRVLIAGYGQTADLYDPASGTFSRTSGMLEDQYGPEATLLANGKVLFTGGSRMMPGGFFLARPELYDPATGMFAATGAYLDATLGSDEYGGEVEATRLLSGKVLVAIGNGSAAELYDPASGTFSWTGALSTTGQATTIERTATRLEDGKVLLAGGWNQGDLDFLAGAELYDESTGAFAPTGSMGIVRAGHTATLLPNGRVLVAGGHWHFTVLRSAELYDPALGTFAPAGRMNLPRRMHQATLLNDGRVLITGGRIADFTPSMIETASAELYIPGASSGGIAARRTGKTAAQAIAR